MMIRFILLGASEFVASLYSSMVMRKMLVLKMSGMFLIFLEFVRLKRIVLFWLRDEKVYWICGFRYKLLISKENRTLLIVSCVRLRKIPLNLYFLLMQPVSCSCFVLSVCFFFFFFTLFNWLKEKQQLIA